MRFLSFLLLGSAAVLLLKPLAVAQAPTLVSVSPVAGARAVPRNAPLTVTFSQPMSDYSRRFGTGIRLFSKQRGGLLTHLTPTGQDGPGGTFSGRQTPTISFAPARPFMAGEELTAVVTTGATAVNGQPLVGPRTWTFRAGTAAAGMAVFATGVAVPVNGGAWAVAAADVDNDNDLDLLAVAGPGLSIRLNQGNGTFAPTGVEWPASYDPWDLTMLDADLDGNLDVLVPCTGSNNITLSLGDGTGNFNYGFDPVVGMGPKQVVTADLDADGDLDSFSHSPFGMAAAVCYNDNYGAYNGAPYFLAQPWVTTAVAAGDLDADGLPDLIVAALAQGAMRFMRNMGNRQFGAFSTLMTLTTSGPTQIEIADFTGDGVPDILIGNNDVTSAPMELAVNSGTGIFTSQWVESNVTTIPRNGNFAVGDLDGDGDLDIVVLQGVRGITAVRSIFRNNGTGSFTLAASFNQGPAAGRPVLADLDGDGDLDMAIADPTNSRVMVYRNGGPLATPAEAAEAPAFTLAPNPAHHTVRLTGAPAGPATLVDALGRPVRTWHLASGTSDLSVEGLAPGLYTVRVGGQARRLVVE